jgi:hypothetical protein
MTKYTIYGVSITDENLIFKGINLESCLPYLYLYLNFSLILFTAHLSIFIKIYLQKFAKKIDKRLHSVSNFSLMITKISNAIDPIDLKD